MTRRSLETLIGAAFFLAAGLSLVAVVQVGRLSPFEERQVVWVRFDDVRFLSKGNNVRVGGLDVGRVDDLTLLDDGVLVRLVVDKDVVIRERYRIVVRPLTTLGGQYVELGTGDPRRARVASSRAQPFLGVPEAELTKTISSTISEVEPYVVSAVAHMSEVFDKISSAQGTLGKLLDEDAFPRDVRNVTQRFESTTRQLRTMTSRIYDAQGTLGKLLYDPRFGELAEGLSGRLRSIGDKVAAGTGAVGALAGDEELQAAIDAAREHLAAVLDAVTAEDGVLAAGGRAERIRDDLARTLDHLARIQEAISEGKGPALAITQDPDVARDLERTREHLALFARRPPNSTLARLRSEPSLVGQLGLGQMQGLGSNPEVADIPPVTTSLQGFIRGRFEPPPRGGLNLTSSSSDDE